MTPHADSDLDGHADGIESVLGSDPSSSNSTPVVNGVNSITNRTYSFTPAITSGLTLFIESSTNLVGTWSVVSSRPGNADDWSPPSSGYGILTNSGTGQISVSIPTEPESVFLRMAFSSEQMGDPYFFLLLRDPYFSAKAQDVIFNKSS